MTIWIYSGRPSEGAALLAQEPGFNRMRSGKFYKPGDFIVNWGNAHYLPALAHKLSHRRLNSLDGVLKAVNKRKTFEALGAKSIPTVPWTLYKEVALGWVQQGHTVVARKTLTGHEGDGIIIIEKVNKLVEAPLYTRYVEKAKEFRVHATPFGVIDTQWKVRDPKREVVDWKVRSYKNGFIFQRKGIIPNAKRDALAVAAIKALGLDFGGLDIIEDGDGDFYVLEVNTAPGIEGTTVQLYGKALTDLCRRIADPNYKPQPAQPAGDYKPAGHQAGPRVPPAGAPVGVVNLNALWAK